LSICAAWGVAGGAESPPPPPQATRDARERAVRRGARRVLMAGARLRQSQGEEERRGAGVIPLPRLRDEV
jgi:hypothetical protein